MNEREKIRYRLSVNHLSFVWLIDMLRKRGVETSSPILSAILAGTRSGPSVDKIISESTNILDWDEQKIGGETHESEQFICTGGTRTSQSIKSADRSVCP